MNKSIKIIVCFAILFIKLSGVMAQTNMLLGSGDDIRIQVYQNPDLSTDTRIADAGNIRFPLIGSVQLAGLTLPAAEQIVSAMLEKGGFVKNPQVNITLTGQRANQVSVLGQVTKPGRFVLDTNNLYVTDVLALAGGATSTGDDVVILTGTRNGEKFRKLIDVTQIFENDEKNQNVKVMGGDTLFIPRAAMFYIYGEAQRPGAYKIERGMTVMRALAVGGGPTGRGSENRLRLSRKGKLGEVEQLTPNFNDEIRPDDVLYVKESLF